jgi:predicted phage terminase large subunit-like protein
MPVTHRVLLHTQGPALVAEHKPLAEILELQATTPEGIWNAVYQGAPTAPGGSIFKRAWWRGQEPLRRLGREPRADAVEVHRPLDLLGHALKDETMRPTRRPSSASSAELPDGRPRGLPRPARVPRTAARDGSLTQRYSPDGKLRGVLIEDKASGTSAYQTLMAGASADLRRVLIPFQPVGDKDTRANQAAVWCKNDCVLLPEPSDTVPWLLDFEEELFAIPTSTFRDQADAFAQLIIYTENLLAVASAPRRGEWRQHRWC